jgi:hypothetical protein
MLLLWAPKSGSLRKPLAPVVQISGRKVGTVADDKDVFAVLLGRRAEVVASGLDVALVHDHELIVKYSIIRVGSNSDARS